jgi:3-keto-disaccharide hydrolase
MSAKPLVIAIGAIGAAALLAGSAVSTQGGFTPLFNGKDLSGWKVPVGDNGHWKVLDGAIDYDAESEAPGDDKALWSEREYGNFTLKIDWRIKSTPYINPNVPIILPSGLHKKDVDGKEIRTSVPDSDSGIGYRMDDKMPSAVRAGVTPKRLADRDIGQWNSFDITMRGDRLTVILNGEEVISNAQLPDVPARGAIALQHHGSKKGGVWVSPPSLVQFKNISIKEQ